MTFLQVVVYTTIIVNALITVANSAECYEICGWSSSDYSGAQAILQNAVDCTRTPSNEAWLPVQNFYYQQGPNSPLFLRIKITDSRIDDSIGAFKPSLFFNGYDENGIPIVTTEVLGWNDPPDPNKVIPLYTPPEQADILSLLQTEPNIRVRLRHRNTDNCLSASNTNGAAVYNGWCERSHNSGYLFKLVSAGGGTYRLHHVDTNQCLYALSWNNANVHHWVCWNSPGMRFNIIPSQGGYRLQHVNHNKCIIGNPLSGSVGKVTSSTCGNNPDMVYEIDVVDPPVIIEQNCLLHAVGPQQLPGFPG